MASSLDMPIPLKLSKSTSGSVTLARISRFVRGIFVPPPAQLEPGDPEHRCSYLIQKAEMTGQEILAIEPDVSDQDAVLLHAAHIPSG